MPKTDCPRLRTQAVEAVTLSEYACQSARSAGRARAETPCDVRTDFQRDIDRITHSKAFRRLMYKTQVFLCPEGDHYRTRLTHAMEVSRIARTIACGLRLNEDLTEAIALGHDLGHAPFGHAGERALNEMLPGGFAHNRQSRRVMELLENGGQGRNLTLETLDGMECHSGAKRAATLEGRIVALADRIAYINHDLDDAIRAGLLTEEALPGHVREIMGNGYSKRIDTLTRNAIDRSSDDIRLDPEVSKAMDDMRNFMFEKVYKNPIAKGEEGKAIDMIRRMFTYYAQAPDRLPAEFRPIIEAEGAQRATADYISGMTDRFFLEKASELFLPRGWEKH